MKKAFKRLSFVCGLLAVILLTAGCDGFEGENPSDTGTGTAVLKVLNVPACASGFNTNTMEPSEDLCSEDTPALDDKSNKMVYAITFKDIGYGPYTFTVSPKSDADFDKYEFVSVDVGVEGGKTVETEPFNLPLIDGGDGPDDPEDLCLEELTENGNEKSAALDTASLACETDTGEFIAGNVSEDALALKIADVKTALIPAANAYNALDDALIKAEGRDDIDAQVITDAEAARDALLAAIERANKAIAAAEKAIRDAHDPDDPVDPDMLGEVEFCITDENWDFIEATVTEILVGRNEPKTHTGCFTFKGLPRGKEIQFDISAEGYSTHRTEEMVLDVEIPILNVVLDAETDLNDGDLYLGTDDPPLFTVFKDGEPLPITLDVWVMENGQLRKLEAGEFTCDHEEAVDRVSVDTACTAITPGGEAGCEPITVEYNGATIDFHATNVDKAGSDSPGDWDAGEACN